ncbi:MAG TPA: hypothetical protein VGB83_05990 [Actinomycetota bacterium]
MRSSSTRRWLSLIVAAATLVTAGTAAADPTDPALDFSATPGRSCGANDLPETTQGRVPLADFDSGRAALGYTCNASEVSHIGGDDGPNAGSQGGYRVHRYVDSTGQVCAFYDTTLLFPANSTAAGPDTGVWVLDMSDPANPVHTATLSSPAMQSPHESFSLNTARGLLGAVFANPAFYHGQFDLYDVSKDCLHPKLRASLPMGVLGHEGSFAPDGKTYYASSLYGHTLTAIDTSNTLAPRIVWTSTQWNVHGMNLSEDGNLMYFADLARNGADAAGDPAGSETKGLTVLDVSQVQARTLNPQVSVVSHLTWPHVSTPQTNLPITIGGRDYLVEVDEFGSGDNVGAARIIDVEDPAAPRVVSNIRLAVNNADHQNDGQQSQDPNSTNSLAGYTGHYCSVPRTVNPGIVACSFILSGLRVFDIHNPKRPIEIAYFNKPATTTQLGTEGEGPQGSYAMSQPAFDVARRQIWYSDGNSGFYVVQIENGVWE